MTKIKPHCHPERSRRILLSCRKRFATGFLDFARNDREWLHRFMEHEDEQEHE
jgi:hypothetical protein